MYRLAKWMALALAATMLLTPLSSASNAHPTIGGDLGVVTIYANGSISNPSAPISVSGNVYQLTGPFVGSLVVLANDVVVDGAGFAINYSTGTSGSDGAAVTVANASGVTVEHFLSLNASIGIYANNTTGVVIQQNSVRGSLEDIQVTYSLAPTVTGNNETGPIGALGTDVEDSTYATVTGNNASSNAYGFSFVNCSNVQVSNNEANFSRNSGVSIQNSRGVSVSHNLLESNGTGTGYAVYITGSTGIAVTANNGNGSYDGFEADYSQGIVFDGNNASFELGPDSGIGAYYSTNVQGVGNAAFGSTYAVWSEYSVSVDFENNTGARAVDAIYDYENLNFSASGNTMPFASGYGIYSYFSSGSTFRGNNLTGVLGTSGAAYLESSGNVLLQGNDLSNTYYGVYAYDMYGPVAVIGNQLTNSTYGVYFYDDYGAVTADGNNIANPPGTPTSYGIYAYYTYGGVTLSNNSIPNAGYGVYAEYAYGNLTISGNDIANASSDGIYTYYVYGSVSVTNNNLSNASYAGIYQDYYTYGNTLVLGNDIRNASWYGVYSYENYGSLTITGNDIANASNYGVYDEYVYGAVSILGNDVSNSSGGIYNYEDYGGASILGNDVSNASYIGIASYYAYGTVNVSDNIAVNCYDGIYLYEDYGPESTVGNSVQNATQVAIYDYYFDGPGGFVMMHNNASGSNYALDVEYAYSSYGNEVIGNDFSNSAYIYVYDSYFYGGFIGNNMLNDSSIYFTSDQFGAFTHNDINSTAFLQSGNYLTLGTWNTAYPVGGNFWSGYSGIDVRSGVYQNLSGSDGIGDTPYALGGAVDQYPLMTRWVAPMVSFSESGLPSGSTWSVTFNGAAETAMAGQMIHFLQMNGANTPYTYTVAWAALGYATSMSSGSGVMQGSDQSIQVTFTPITYAVNFTETGLANGTSWSVTLHAVPSTSTTSSIVFQEMDGTYAYQVTPVAGYQLASGSGTVTVSGAAVSVNVAFTPVTYTVTFEIVGLTSGASWSVNLNGTTHSSTTTSVSFTVANGTYAFTVTVPNGYTATPTSSHVRVAGAPVSIYLSSYPGGAPSTSSSTSTWSDSQVYGLLAVLIVALLAAIVGWLLYLRNRRSGGSGGAPPPPVPWGATGTPSAAPPPSPPTPPMQTLVPPPPPPS
ncbi:MAG: right-handed parallel beta-helix repeat-containing protein [Thermoplasmata archaeon]